jgi:uncharacterized protein (TIGR00369 family)
VEVEAPPELPEPAEEPSWPSPPPYLRPVQGGVVPQATWDRLSGLEVMQGHLSGEIPAPPLTYLTGLWPVAAAEGRMTWRMPASEWLCGPLQGQLYGGATAFLAGTAIDGAVQTTVPAGTAFAPVDLKVYFLRPVPPDGRLLLAESQIVHRGRTTAIATAEVRNADGKVVALATGSSMILPGRPASLARG